MQHENPERTMPTYSQNQGSKKPYAGAKGSNPGARSEGHRGYRADASSAAPKKRWNADERSARTADRTGNSAGRPGTGDKRPNWTPTDKPSHGDRPQRGSYGDRPARPAYGDRTERPAYGDRTERPARPSYGDRNERPARGNDRPSYNS